MRISHGAARKKATVMATRTATDAVTAAVVQVGAPPRQQEEGSTHAEEDADAGRGGGADGEPRAGEHQVALRRPQRDLQREGAGRPGAHGEPKRGAAGQQLDPAPRG